MSRPTRPTYKTRNWSAYNEGLKRRRSLTIWFDPKMTWEAAPTGKRGRQPIYSDAAIQTCLTMKVLFGMALRQTTGFVESLLRLIDLEWTVPDFSTLSRRQKALKVDIPYRGSQGPLHLLIDSTGIKVEGEGEWNARKHGGAKRRVGGRYTSELTNKRWRSGRRSSPPAMWGTHPCCPSFSIRSRLTRRSRVSPLTAPSTPASATTPSPPAALRRSYRPERTANPGRPMAPGRSHGMKPSVHRGASVAPSGDDGAAITAEAAQRPKCTASNSWANAWRRGTSTVRSPSSSFVWPS